MNTTELRNADEITESFIAGLNQCTDAIGAALALLGEDPRAQALADAINDILEAEMKDSANPPQ